ncbi:MAG: GNAT family N-acetyltransferase, partial [Flavobacteriales bacterium]|nr:GNAT family N-acetyltransferase [Flavobacteriales bacterium]
YQGVWLNYPEGQKYTSRLSFEKEVMEVLIDALPAVDEFQQKFASTVTNWLPFYWKGFTQTTRYTYIIHNLSDLEAVRSDFRENIRREIKKAEKDLVIKTLAGVDELYSLKQEVYQHNQEVYPIPKELLEKAYAYTKGQGCGEVLAAYDATGSLHSILFYVWDQHAAYYLHGGTAHAFKTGGSMSLLLWEAIRRSAKTSQVFNFEGSMIESIERYFRAFGGEQVPYFEISRTNSRLLKFLKH